MIEKTIEAAKTNAGVDRKTRLTQDGSRHVILMAVDTLVLSNQWPQFFLINGR
jgi:hypothetical protein